MRCLRTYLKQYLDKSKSAYTNQVKAFRRFFRDFLDAGHLIATFQLPKSEFTPTIVPSKDELTTFCRSLNSLRDKALFLMFASTGLRKAEILSLTFEDLDREQRMVYPRRKANSTTKKSWVSFYNEEAEAALDTYLISRHDDDQRV